MGFITRLVFRVDLGLWALGSKLERNDGGFAGFKNDDFGAADLMT
jgi:hypothetical protein